MTHRKSYTIWMDPAVWEKYQIVHKILDIPMSHTLELHAKRLAGRYARIIARAGEDPKKTIVETDRGITITDPVSGPQKCQREQ